jgi:adenylyl cyclase-associated protein
MASADVIKRLEAVAAKLEAYANNLPAAGSSSGGARSRESKESPAVSGFAAYYAAAVQPFIDTVKAVKETAYIADIVEKAFKHTGVFIEAATKCKKPAQAELMKFLGPVPTALADAEKKVDNRSAFMPQQKSVAEGLNALNFLVMPGTAKDIVNNGLEQADFYLIKILNLAKTKAGDEQKGLRDFVANFKGMLNKLGEYADEFFPKGIDWNPKGADFSTFTPGSSGAAAAAPVVAEDESGGAPPPPPGPPPTAEELSGSSTPPPAATGAAPGMGAVFGAINKGLDVTKGLKKVDNSQKAKNMKDVPVLVPKEKKDIVPAKKFGAPAEKKPAKLEFTKGTWFCENYEDQQLIEIKDVEIKSSVYISKCKNCTITIPDKIKSIVVDGCVKVRVVFRSIVSVFELFNSQRCVAECTDVFPAIAIDKSSGCIVVVSRPGLAALPHIVTSNISECNVQVPGATDDDDPIEIPIPEQYETHIELNGTPGPKAYKLRTHPAAHGE